MAAGSGGAPGSAGTQDTRVARIEEGVAGLQTTHASSGNFYDANWPTYPLTPASLTVGSGTSGVIFTASGYYGGLIGNAITITYVSAGALSVVVNGYNITVNYNSGTTTAAQVAAAVNAATEPVQGAGGYTKPATQKLVVATLVSTGAGTTLSPSGPTALSGATAATFNTFDAGLAAGVEPGRAVAQVDTQWENSGLDPWAALKLADPTKW